MWGYMLAWVVCGPLSLVITTKFPSDRRISPVSSLHAKLTLKWICTVTGQAQWWQWRVVYTCVWVLEALFSCGEWLISLVLTIWVQNREIKTALFSCKMDFGLSYLVFSICECSNNQVSPVLSTCVNPQALNLINIKQLSFTFPGHCKNDVTAEIWLILHWFWILKEESMAQSCMQ